MQDQTLLTTIVSVDPIYAYFDVDESTVLHVRELIRTGKMQSAREVSVPAWLSVANDEGFSHEGTINFIDNQIDPKTGTLRVRGVFPNKDETLSPGFFVRVRVRIGVPHEAILVSERAIQADQGQKIVYVVNDKEEVVYRPIRVGARHGSLIEVVDGLKVDERIVVNGLQRVRPARPSSRSWSTCRVHLNWPPRRRQMQLRAAPQFPSSSDFAVRLSMLARFFIDRPVLAWVLSLVIVLMGLIALGLLPIAQYPPITPPTVRVSANYPGANAQVVADTVAAPIEQQVNGVESMLYMSSQSGNDGSYGLDVTFQIGTDLNMAQVLVQNRVAIAQPTLPDTVRAIGVPVKKRSPDILLVVSLYSEDDPATGKPYFNRLYMSNYATIHLLDALTRIDGVGDVLHLRRSGLQHAGVARPGQAVVPQSHGRRRDPRAPRAKCAGGRGPDRSAAGADGPAFSIHDQHARTADRRGSICQYRAGEPEPDGEVTYLKDCARIELGAKNLDQTLTLDGKPSVGLAIFQLPGSNALDVGDRVKAEMLKLEKSFPRGLKYGIAYDTTPFIHESVDEVFKTLRDAVILVAIVVLLFLQDWKSLMLPIIDVGVSLIGTFAVMRLLGFQLEQPDAVRSGAGDRHRGR